MMQISTGTPGQKDLVELFVILAVSIPLIFWGIGSISFRDPDEGMYGAIARAMAEGGDWITPRFNGLAYFERPPLYFWLTGLTMLAFGPVEWATFIWGGISALGTIFLVWQIGKWLYANHAGLLSAIVFATSVGIYHYSHVAFADLLLVFFVTLSVFGFIHGFLYGRGKRTDYLVFYLGAALAVLTKGLIGLVFPTVIVGLFVLCHRHDAKLRSMNLKWGIGLFLAVVLPWHVLAARNNPGFLFFYFVDNHFMRFFRAREVIEDDVQLNALSFLIAFLVWFFPWTLCLAASLGNGLPGTRGDGSAKEKLRLLVGLWAAAVIGFFSVSLARLEHYSLPAIPAVSLMVGGRWADAFASSRPDWRLKWCLGAGGLGCLIFGFWLLTDGGLLNSHYYAFFAGLQGYYRTLQAQAWEFPHSPTALASLGMWLGLTLVLGPTAAFILLSRGRIKASFTAFVITAIGIAAFVFDLHFLTEPDRSSRSVARALSLHSGPGDPIIHEGLLDYSAGLVFYTGRRIYVLNGKRGALEFGSRYSGIEDVFLDDEKFNRFWGGHQRVFLVTRFQRRDSAVTKLPEEKVFLIGQYGSRRLYSNKPTADGSK